MTAQSGQSSPSSGWVLYLRLLAYVIHHKAVMLSGLLGLLFLLPPALLLQWLGWTLVHQPESYEQAGILIQSSQRYRFGRGAGSFLGGYSMAYLAQQVMLSFAVN